TCDGQLIDGRIIAKDESPARRNRRQSIEGDALVEVAAAAAERDIAPERVQSRADRLRQRSEPRSDAHRAEGCAAGAGDRQVPRRGVAVERAVEANARA